MIMGNCIVIYISLNNQDNEHISRTSNKALLGTRHKWRVPRTLTLGTDKYDQAYCL